MTRRRVSVPRKTETDAQRRKRAPAKPLAELTDDDISAMSKAQLIDRLTRLNAFGGYSEKDKTWWLRKSLSGWRDRAKQARGKV